jgi:DNA mismatch repair protein MutS
MPLGEEDETPYDAEPPAPAPSSPMMAQYLQIKRAHAGYLLFYRMGDFYELFFEDAVAASAALDIALTKRGKHQSQDIPMCGVPAHAAETYLERLIRKGFKVAICEQTEDPALAKKRGSKSVVAREVVRLVTPGTLTEDQLLDPRRPNNLAALVRVQDRIALAWLDMTAGELMVSLVEPVALAATIARVAPGELLISDALSNEPRFEAIVKEYGPKATLLPAASFDFFSCERALKSVYEVASLDGLGQFERAEIAAAGALASYLELTQKGRLPPLRPFKRADDAGFMFIDPATRRNLELTETLTGARAGSLLGSIDRTITAAGGRLLTNRLLAPLTGVAAIQSRLDSVQYFAAHERLRNGVRQVLRKAPDIARALTRLVVGRGGPRDLGALRDGLSAGYGLEPLLAAQTDPLIMPPEEIRAAIACFQDCSPALAALMARMKDVLEAELPLLARDGGFVRPGAEPKLDAARSLRDDSRRVIASLEHRLRGETSVASLKIRHNAILGYFIEISQTHAERVRTDAGFIHRQTMAGAMRFSTPELGELASRIADAAGEALTFEMSIFEELTLSVREAARDLAACADALATIDVAAALAELSVDAKYVRPVLDEGLDFKIEGGRHPTVEAALKAQGDQGFVPNDCDLSRSGPGRLWLVTGPNMAGKSTFLRQQAIFAVLAQMGSFVPAALAHIGIVDRLFSRVGAADDLARGRSTFMVEMVETAAILNTAGPKSLVILDEIGRGTATYDGLSIAWATIEHLNGVNKCRGLFATHYHELTALAHTLSGVTNFTAQVKEWKGGVVFLHSIVPGASDRSYGIQVAKLAGLPAKAVVRAKAILATLETQALGRNLAAKITDLPLFSQSHTERDQLPDLENQRRIAIERALDEAELDALSPKAALEFLYKLKAISRRD